MKPCSAYCRPDEGIHVWVDRSTHPAGASVHHTHALLEVGPHVELCVPAGTLIQLISEEEAVEYDEEEMAKHDPVGHPYVLLMTFQVSSLRQLVEAILVRFMEEDADA